MTTLLNPPKKWTPPHCPNKNCLSHKALRAPWRFREFASYFRKTDNRHVQRFKCLSCGRTFSTQTFSTTYWQKRPELNKQILLSSANGMANSQIARVLDCAPSTVDRKLARMGRHCLLFLLMMLKAGKPVEEIVYDGLETFELSQFYPYYLNIAVEKSSDYLLAFNESELRRSGATTDQQKKRIKELEAMHGRPDPKAIEKSTAEIFKDLIGHRCNVCIFTDMHNQYIKPIKKLGNQVTHLKTSGKDPRNRHNDLFAVNRMDMMLRHSNKNHTRETIAFSKRRQAGMEKVAIFSVYMNFMMDRRQRGVSGLTPAMIRGVAERKLVYDDVFEGRLFVFQFDLPKKWEDYYFRKIVTRALPRNKGHTLRYAA